MNKNKYTCLSPSFQRFQQLLPLILWLLLLFSGCCKNEEPVSGKALKFVIGGEGQVQADAIREIEIFVYDDKERLIGRTSSQIDGTVILDYPDIPTLYCIAWGNSKDDALEISPVKTGDPMENGYLALKALLTTRTETQYYYMPPNLFRGIVKIDNNTVSDNTQEDRISMLQTVTPVYITIRGLQNATGTDKGNYTITVGGAASRIDFMGSYGGIKTVHQLTGTFNAEKEYIIPVFYLFPLPVEGEGLTIDIRHDGKLLKSITKTNDGKPIVPLAGKPLELRISFTLSGVDVNPPGWNSTDIEVNYPR